MGNGASVRDVHQIGAMTDQFCCSQSVKHASDDLGRTGALEVVDRLGLEQFCVRQNDAQLVVQLVKQQA